MGIEYLHTMVRVADLEKSIAFYKLLGLEETRRYENDKGRFTLVFMSPPGQENAAVEKTTKYSTSTARQSAEGDAQGALEESNENSAACAEKETAEKL